ncbi:MAG TPA: hypothetical protein VMT53_22220 [Terriglobales bacterium]|nr:hypothetical protein [Terriglobales bacterium]
MRNLNKLALAFTLVMEFACFTTIAVAGSISDNFNRPDGTVGNGWMAFGNGADILNGQLETFGQPNVGGGVQTTATITFPLTFSFDFRTNNPPFGGWLIGFNSPAISAESCNCWEFALGRVHTN